ncbi:MAG: penicillin acylase family protein, partial [Calditrichaeota bacterium]
EDPRMREVVEAYTAGVNAWIEQLDPAEYPVEYKIFNYRPEPWTPLKCALLLKYMAWRLSGYNEELPRSRARAVLGDSVADQLYFRETPLAQPIIPPGTPWNFQPLASPTPPSSFFTPIPLAELEPVPPDAAVGGSNNWAVSGAKTASGYPILCNDPHLSFSLPSVWYEIQLASPNVNVYGVSLPGAPAVIIGFNENIAWGVTNTETDVLDWYRIRFRDDRCREYYYDGKWQPTTFRVETIRVRGQEAVIDSIPFTHHGPVVYRATEKPFDENIPVGMALRWTGHDPSRELKSFVLLNRAKNYPDFVEAISYFDCPGQNFAFADREGDIAIHHNGKFPLRWEKQGRYISDGADPAYDWAGWIPREQVPQVKNPPQGFVQSANQKPVDKTYPYYLGGHYAGFERGRRIHERLAEMERITPEDMMELQRDILNVHARTVLPTLLRILAQADLSLAEVRDYEILRHWDYRQRR